MTAIDQLDYHGRRYVEFSLTVKRPGAPGTCFREIGSLAELDAAFLRALQQPAEYIEAETVTEDETGQRTSRRWARLWCGEVERRPTEDAELMPCAPDGSFLPGPPPPPWTAPVGITLSAARRQREDTYFAKAPFPVDEIPFAVALRAGAAAPPRRPWEAADEVHANALDAARHAQHAARRRLQVAGLVLDMEDGMVLIDTEGEVAQHLAEVNIVIGADSRYRAAVNPRFGVSRRHPMILAARQALAGAWWPAPPMNDALLSSPWLQNCAGLEARIAAAARHTNDLPTKTGRRGGFAELARREVKLLADLHPLNLDRRGFRVWMRTSIMIAVLNDDGSLDDPAQVTALVKWPFAIREVEDGSAPAPYRLIHLPSGYAMAHHADPHALRRLANSIVGLIDWEWRRPTPAQVAQAMSTVRRHLSAGTWVATEHGSKLAVRGRRRSMLIPAAMVRRVEKRTSRPARRRDKAA